MKDKLVKRITEAVNASRVSTAIGVHDLSTDYSGWQNSYNVGGVAERHKKSKRIAVTLWEQPYTERSDLLRLDEIDDWPEKNIAAAYNLAWTPKEPKHPLVQLAEEGE